MHFVKVLFELFTSNLGVLKQNNESQSNYVSRVINRRFDRYNSLFTEENFQTDRKTFVNKFAHIKDDFAKRGKRHSGAKNTSLQKFNEDSWMKL